MRARSHAELFWCVPKAARCVPARTRRTLAYPEGSSVRARTHAAHSGVSRRRFRACSRARGALCRYSESASVRPARTRRTLVRHGGAPVRARSHAAHSGVSRRRFRVRPHARGAHGRGPKVFPCVHACTRRPWARSEGDSVRARSHAGHPGAPRGRCRACPLAIWCSPKLHIGNLERRLHEVPRRARSEQI